MTRGVVGRVAFHMLKGLHSICWKGSTPYGGTGYRAVGGSTKYRGRKTLPRSVN